MGALPASSLLNQFLAYQHQTPDPAKGTDTQPIGFSSCLKLLLNAEGLLCILKERVS